MCFSLPWLEHILIDIVIAVAVIAILKVFLPWVLNQLGVGSGMVMKVIDIVIWAVVVIFIIVIVFALLSCVTLGRW